MKRNQYNVQNVVMNLRLDWCSYEAAKHAVMNWHYSKTMPFGKTLKIGVWEYNKFIGVVLYGYSSTPNVAKGAKLKQQEIVELTRVALNNHKSSVSKIISISIKMLKYSNPGLKLVVSFADADQSHIGVIYQAGSWIYTGLNMKNAKNGYIVNGDFLHCRSAGMKIGRNTLETVRKYLDPNAIVHYTKGKYRYLYPLNKEMRKQIEPLAKPYPKKNCDSGVNRSTPSFQDGGGGADPTESLYNYPQS